MFFVLLQVWDKEKFWDLKINKFPLKCPVTLPQGNFYYFTFYFLDQYSSLQQKHSAF